MVDTVSEALAVGCRRLSASGISGARQDARLLLCHATGYTFAQLVTEAQTDLSASENEKFDELIARRAAREPVSHLLGRREFWSLSFGVSSAVLDPRPDSETLIEAALDYCSHKDAEIWVLDLGTGSGCLLLSLLTERPNATGVGVDLSSDALGVAVANAERLDLASRAWFLRGDWSATIRAEFDIVICNPPYVATADIVELEPEVVKFEPLLALDGGTDGLAAYRRLLPNVKNLLSKSGIGVVEIGVGQKDAVSRIIEDSGLVVLEVRPDLAGIDRCLIFGSTPIFTVT